MIAAVALCPIIYTARILNSNRSYKTMNERPGVNLGVIEDMESTLLPDNHTVKARGVWLMDGDKADIFYESGALGGVQHELSCLKDDIRKLADVGLIFDGHDECNEDTHETNEKLLTRALDRIHRLVTGQEESEG